MVLVMIHVTQYFNNMKLRFTNLLVFLIIAILIEGCAKPDTTPPVITLSGANPDTLFLNQNYVEPGYSAIDNKDGDITSHISISGIPPFNSNFIGTYLKIYSVNDAAGNIDTAVRTVVVYNQATILSGHYQATTNCQITGGPLSFNSDIYPCDSVNFDIWFSNFGAFGINQLVLASYNDTTNTLSFNCPQPLGGNNLLVSATGRIAGSAPHYTITINYSWSDGTNTDDCTATYSD
jgi:hypothetical protein